MQTLSTERVPIPARMASLPRDPARTHLPVPWFVAWFEGKPDFRCMDGDKLRDAIRFQKCWLCGKKLGSVKSFVIGPMCAVNRISSEPPSHLDCAEYAVKICPFLSQPNMRRNEKDLPELRETAGIAIARNPGCALIWSTTRFKVSQVHNGILFDLGEPYALSFWAEGRIATRAEILHSMETGLPALREMADIDGPEAHEFLDIEYAKALSLVPSA